MEIVLALIAFVSLVLSWFVLPSTAVETATAPSWNPSEKIQVAAAEA
jgi:hypothetical protein